jgi:hypothetical protein
LIAATEISPEVARRLWDDFPIHAWDMIEEEDWILDDKFDIDLLNHDFVVLYIHNK